MALSFEQDQRMTDLMAKAQAGDKAAYAQLLQEITGLLRGFIAARTESTEAAEDVVQETLLSIHCSRHTFRQGRPFAPWMYAIARFRLADHWRKQARRVVCDPLEDNINAPEISSSLGSHVQDALNDLPEKQRRVVELLKMQGLSLKEAAEKLRMTESALKVTAHRAYKRLRRQFAETAHGHE